LEPLTKAIDESSIPKEVTVAATDKDNAGLIDQLQLTALREIQQPGEPDFVTELIDLFFNETDLHLKALREAVIDNDSVKLRRLAHLLKGSSANIGARTMAALYEEMEGENRTNGERAASFAKIEIEFALVREALKAERKGFPE